MSKNKTVVITGASGTLCSEIAKDLALKGHRIGLIGRTREKLEKLAEEVRGKGGRAFPVVADVTNIEQVKQAASQLEEAIGCCSALINGAGGKLDGTVTDRAEFTSAELADDGSVYGFLNCDMEAFRREVDLNLCGTAIPSQVFGRQIARAGGGAMVNFASMTSFRALSRVAPYGAAKAGVVHFTQWLASYLAPAKIRVNAVAPGFIINERNRKLLFDEGGNPSERGANVLRHTPAGRFGEARELLGAINWLLDDEAASFVTGVTIPIDGGFLSSPGC